MDDKGARGSVNGLRHYSTRWVIADSIHDVIDFFQST
jgi:hypothetical protein